MLTVVGKKQTKKKREKPAALETNPESEEVLQRQTEYDYAGATSVGLI